MKQNNNGIFYESMLRVLLLGSLFLVTSVTNGDVISINRNFNKANILSATNNETSDYIHIDINNQLQSQPMLAQSNTDLDLTTISSDVLHRNKKYLIDFSGIKSNTDMIHAKQRFYDKSSVVAFNKANRIFISRYKGLVMYTPIEAGDDIQAVSKELDKLSVVKNKALLSTINTGIPKVSFYININENLPEDDCKFPTYFGSYKSDDKPADYISFCNKPYMKLKYLVSYARSLPHNGAGVPDAKVVKITIDDDNSGTGIGLLSDGKVPELLKEVRKDHSPAVGSVHIDYSASAIAQDYTFKIQTVDGGDFTSILAARPDNLNREYNGTITSTTKYGIVPKAEIAYTPSFNLTGSAEYTDTRSLSFNTQDYKVTKFQVGSNGIGFKWERDQYSQADELRNINQIQFVTVNQFPLDLKRIQPVGYANFVPKFDVTYVAPANATGSTTFSIDSSVLIRPIWSRAIYSAYWLYYEGIDREKYWKRSQFIREFTVNWNHPVFLGGWPVSLQFVDLPGCMGINSADGIKTEQCDLDAVNQSFMYDKQMRYRSVKNLSLCLDAEDLTKLHDCSGAITQQWQWEESHLVNKHKSKILIYSITDGSLSLIDPKDKIPDGHSTVMGSTFTIFYDK